MAKFSNLENFDKLDINTRKKTMPFDVITGADVHDGSIILNIESIIQNYNSDLKVFKVKRIAHIKPGKHGSARCDVSLKDLFLNTTKNCSFKLSDLIVQPVLTRGVISICNDEFSNNVVGNVIDTSDVEAVEFFSEVIMTKDDLDGIQISNSEVKFTTWGPFLKIL